MSMDVKESVKEILLHKGKLIKNNRGYRQHIVRILKDQGIKGSNDTIKAFVVGAVDGMIYDIACSLGFTKHWSAYKMRRKILNKLWKNK